MRQDFQKINQDLQMRPITAQDVEAVRAHVANIRQGVNLSSAYKDSQFIIINRTVKEVYEKYPEKVDMYRACIEKTVRDMHLVAGYINYTALLDDPSYAKNKMFIWFRSVLKNFEFGDDFIADCYTILKSNVEKYIGGPEAEMMNGYIDDAIEIFVS